MKLIIGSDHAAFEAKEFVKSALAGRFDIVDVGTHSMDSCHYPTFAMVLAKEVVKNNCKGILLCGSGIGVSMVANRFAGIRAALCRSPQEATLSVEHNNANVLCLGARITPQEQLLSIVEAWFNASFAGGRHSERLELFNKLGEC